MRYPSWSKGEFEISTDPAHINLAVVHAFLTTSYWAKDVPMDTVVRSVQHSICFGVYKGREQAGFARVISDRATFAYVGDVFVLGPYRGQGLSKWLMECILSHPDLQSLRRWSLVTQDAHDLYRQFGFTDLKSPGRWMERHDPETYARKGPGGVQE